MPIIDYHNHLNEVEILENKHYAKLAEVWILYSLNSRDYKVITDTVDGMEDQMKILLISNFMGMRKYPRGSLMNISEES